jgi:DNA-directed RNA polymerase
MLTCKILDKKTVTTSTKEKINIILPSKLLTDTITNRIVYNIPKKLPMLVPPKAYTNNSLGGYLLNDEVTTDPILISK